MTVEDRVLRRTSRSRRSLPEKGRLRSRRRPNRWSKARPPRTPSNPPTLDNGIRVMVPPFLGVGEKIEVMTESDGICKRGLDPDPPRRPFGQRALFSQPTEDCSHGQSYTANLNVMVQAARKAARRLDAGFRRGREPAGLGQGRRPISSRTPIIKSEEDHSRGIDPCARPAYGWIVRRKATEAHRGRSTAGAGSSIRWMGPRISCTACPIGRSRSPWSTSREIVAAVVLDPVKDEMFTAEKGQGAWLNGRSAGCGSSNRRRPFRMPVRDRRALMPPRQTLLPQALSELARLMPRCAGVRRFGCRVPRSRLCRRGPV